MIVVEAATQAQLVAPAMVIVTAVTAIASFTIPTQVMNEPILLIRLVLTIVSGILGLWGILIFTLLLLGHLASLRSFGMPYLAPAAPLVPEDLDDFLVRAPLWQMKTRPRLLALRNLLRQGKRPSPAKKGTETQEVMMVDPQKAWASSYWLSCYISGCWDSHELNDITLITGDGP